MKLSDIDSKLLKSVSIHFSGSFAEDEDIISYLTAKGMPAEMDHDSNTLTITALATSAQYMAALKRITFSLAGATSSSPTRTLTFTVIDDAGTLSVPVDRVLQIIT